MTTYSLGLEANDDRTAWATVTLPAAHIDAGDEPTVVAVGADQRLIGGRDATVAAGPVSGFVSRLGQSEPVIVSATPYGIEALLAVVFRSIIAGRGSSMPVRVGIAHPDALDAYRTGLLAEACRTAGIAADDIVLVARRDALQAAAAAGIPTDNPRAAAIGAALVAPQRKPVAFAPPSPASNAALAAGVLAAGAVGAAVGDALSAAPAAAGSATGAGAGPLGSPLTTGPAGPTGVPLQPSPGPSGVPLQPVQGPTGTTLQAPNAGPTGTPIGSGPTPGAGHATLARKLATKTKLLIGAGAVVVAGVAATAVAGLGDDKSSSSSDTTNVVAITTVPVVPVDPATTVFDATTSPTTVAAAAGAGAECTIGSWVFAPETALTFWNTIGAAEGSPLGATSVTGDFTITVDETSLWTITFNDWTVTFEEDPPVQLTWTGVDTAQGDFGDDGTFAYSGLVSNSTLSVVAEGFNLAVPSQPDVLSGGGQYVCGSDSLTLTFDANPEPYVLTRRG